MIVQHAVLPFFLLLKGIYIIYTAAGSFFIDIYIMVAQMAIFSVPQWHSFLTSEYDYKQLQSVFLRIQMKTIDDIFFTIINNTVWINCLCTTSDFFYSFNDHNFYNEYNW